LLLLELVALAQIMAAFWRVRELKLLLSLAESIFAQLKRMDF
jgi:hypothetical protein